jgi:hypothetical protein
VTSSNVSGAQLRDALNSAVPSPMNRNDRQRFVGWVMKLKRGGSGRSKPRHYVQWILFAAVAAVIVGLIAVGLTLLH